MELKCASCAVRACHAEPGTVEYPDLYPIPASADVLARARRIYDEDEATRTLTAATTRNNRGQR